LISFRLFVFLEFSQHTQKAALDVVHNIITSNPTPDALASFCPEVFVGIGVQRKIASSTGTGRENRDFSE
jgi:hypothetical protein